MLNLWNTQGCVENDVWNTIQQVLVFVERAKFEYRE